MHPILFKIGNLSIYSWGFMLAIAVLLAIWGISRLFEQEGYNRDMVLDMVILMVVFGIIVARLSYIVVYEWQEFLAHPLSFFSLQNGGISGLIWYGAFLGGFIPFAIYIWHKQLSFWKVTDMFAPFLALGYAIVRIGCFLNGCCYGEITNSVCGVVFPYVDAFTRHPTQLYSSAINLVLFAFLIWFYPRRKFPGQVFLLYLMGYSLYRFIVEFFRFNLITYGPISLGQVYTIGLFIIALVLYLWQRYRYRQTF
ncbi:prolipoprotein diacylglyceryl transferase [Syntrophomonas erecta]